MPIHGVTPEDLGQSSSRAWRTCGEKGGLHVLGASGQIRHQEGRASQVALVVAEINPPEFPAGFAGGGGVLHAVAPLDLGREEFRVGFDLLVQELPEQSRVLDNSGSSGGSARSPV